MPNAAMSDSTLVTILIAFSLRESDRRRSQPRIPLAVAITLVLDDFGQAEELVPETEAPALRGVAIDRELDGPALDEETHDAAALGEVVHIADREYRFAGDRRDQRGAPLRVEAGREQEMT